MKTGTRDSQLQTRENYQPHTASPEIYPSSSETKDSFPRTPTHGGRFFNSVGRICECKVILGSLLYGRLAAVIEFKDSRQRKML